MARYFSTQERLEKPLSLSAARKLRGCIVRSRLQATGRERHVAQIVPARLIRKLTAEIPDRRESLQCICGGCHGCKLQADHKLCVGDRLGYLEIHRAECRRDVL
jgi:hypothetical protein